MSNKLIWSPNYSVPISSFTIVKSTDMGITFAFLATVDFDTSSGAPNYLPGTKQFFYNDSSGNPGDMYQITASGDNGTSAASLVVTPPASIPLCTIFGYQVDGFGNPGTAIVTCRSIGSKGERWAKTVPGMDAFSTQALGVVAASAEVFTDSNGIWQVSLVQGSYAQIEIPAINFTWTFEVPAKSGPINIRDIPTLRGEALGLFGPEYGERNRFPSS